MSQRGSTRAWLWSPSPRLECGMCFQMPRGSSAFPLSKGHRVAFRVRQAVGGAFTGKTCRVGLGEENYWQWCAMKWQDESRIIRALNLKWFFFISYLFLFFFHVNIFILLWSSNNIWIVTCAECMVGMYSLVGMSICIQRGSEPDPWVFSSCMLSPHSVFSSSLI